MSFLKVHFIVLVAMIIEPFNGFISKYLVEHIGIIPSFLLWSVFGLLFSVSTLLWKGDIMRVMPSFLQYWKEILFILTFACLGWGSWFLALRFETVAIVNMVINSYVFFSIFISYFLLKENFTLPEWFGVALILVGVGILSYQPFDQSIGIVFALLNALFYALQYMFVKRIIDGITPFVLSTIRLTGLSVFGVVLAAIVGLDTVSIIQFDILSLALIGAGGATAVGLLIYVALRHMSYGRLSILKLWQPAILLFISLGIFKENLSHQELIGIVVMCIGTTVMTSKDAMRNYLLIVKHKYRGSDS